jgi:uncharacterized membrane protein
MTETGQALLKEYQSQIKERIDDDKNQLMFNQSKSIFNGVWRFTITFVNVFSVNVLVVATFFLFTVDVPILEAFRAASDQDIVDNIKSFFSVVSVIQTTVMFMFGIFYYRKYFQNIKQERIDYDESETKLRALIIEFSEEVLARHGLIKKGLFND